MSGYSSRVINTYLGKTKTSRLFISHSKNEGSFIASYKKKKKKNYWDLRKLNGYMTEVAFIFI